MEPKGKANDFYNRGVFRLGEETHKNSMKVLSDHSNLWAGLKVHSIGYYKLETQQVFFISFNDKVSREEHKTILSGVRFSGMVLSEQSVLPAFFVPWKINLKMCFSI